MIVCSVFLHMSCGGPVGAFSRALTGHTCIQEHPAAAGHTTMGV